MRLSTVHATNFLSLESLDIDIQMPVLLVAGPNASGKSSVYEGIIFALTGRPHRVELKKRWTDLIRDGADSAAFVVDTDEGGAGITLHTNGAHESRAPDPYETAIANCCLEGHYVTTRGTQYLSDILYRLSPETMTPAQIVGRLRIGGVNKPIAEALEPLLVTGFDAAEKECETRAKVARGKWSQLTNERYGSKKAATWQAPVVEEVGDSEMLRKRVIELESQVSGAREGRSEIYQCPNCMHKLGLHAGQLMEADELPVPDEEAAERLRTDYAEAKAAFDEAVEAEENNAIAEKRTADALKLHKEIEQWVKAQGLLGPQGIPTEAFKKAVEPINVALAKLGRDYGMGTTHITEDATITYNHRNHLLCSESEQWLSNAMFSIAIAELTDYKLVSLDRWDLLAPGRRPQFLSMCAALAAEMDMQILLFATLKSPFENEVVQCQWLGETNV